MSADGLYIFSGVGSTNGYLNVYKLDSITNRYSLHQTLTEGFVIMRSMVLTDDGQWLICGD